MKKVDLQGNVWNCNIEPPISAYGSINLDELNQVIERLNKVPNCDDLIRDNNKKQREIEKLKKANKKLSRIANKNEVENFVLKEKLKEVREKIEGIKSNYFKRYDDEVYKLCDDILEILNKGSDKE